MTDLPLLVMIDDKALAERALLGGKAASLALLAKMGARVPPAFVMTTEAYRHWSQQADEGALRAWIGEGVAALEARTGRKLGSGIGGLTVSVRSGAPVSMPGMMDTVLNVGLGRPASDAPAYARDARRRFLQQFAETVVGLAREEVDAALAEAGGSVCDLDGLEDILAGRAAAAGFDWPRDAEAEIVAAAKAVFASWDSSRAKLYRRMRNIDNDLGTAVTVQLMVFGNFDQASGSGVAFTRDPTTGAPGLCGEFLGGGQGEEVVSGRETAASIEEWAAGFPDQHAELRAIGERLERDSGEVQEIEFTLEAGTLYILQCRRALLTSDAAARVTVDLVADGAIVRKAAIDYACRHGFDPAAAAGRKAVKRDTASFASGLAVGGGVASGRLALSELASARFAQANEPVIFATTETSPSLLPIMQRSAGLVTMLGGATSHAAVVAREIGVPCVVGVGGEVANGRLIAGSGSLGEGEWITIDGNSGALHAGDVAVDGAVVSGPVGTLIAWMTEDGAFNAA